VTGPARSRGRHGKGERIALMGGPFDGRVMTVPDMRPVWLMPAPMPPIWRSDPDASLEPMPQPLEYHMALDDTGFPSRRDDGCLNYELKPEQLSAWIDGQWRAEAPPVIVGCRLKFMGPLRYPVTLACNCGATASEIGELAALLDSESAREHRGTVEQDDDDDEAEAEAVSAEGRPGAGSKDTP
jgi:hypothetical protein